MSDLGEEELGVELVDGLDVAEDGGHQLRGEHVLWPVLLVNSEVENLKCKCNDENKICQICSWRLKTEESTWWCSEQFSGSFSFAMCYNDNEWNEDITENLRACVTSQSHLPLAQTLAVNILQGKTVHISSRSIWYWAGRVCMAWKPLIGQAAWAFSWVNAADRESNCYLIGNTILVWGCYDQG